MKTKIKNKNCMYVSKVSITEAQNLLKRFLKIQKSSQLEPQGVPEDKN